MEPNFITSIKRARKARAKHWTIAWGHSARIPAKHIKTSILSQEFGKLYLHVEFCRYHRLYVVIYLSGSFRQFFGIFLLCFTPTYRWFCFNLARYMTQIAFIDAQNINFHPHADTLNFLWSNISKLAVFVNYTEYFYFRKCFVWFTYMCGSSLMCRAFCAYGFRCTSGRWIMWFMWPLRSKVHRVSWGFWSIRNEYTYERDL